MIMLRRRTAQLVCAVVLVSTACEGATGRDSDSGTGDLPAPTEMGLPASEFVRPDPATAEASLINGTRAYIVEDPGSPLVTVGAVIAAGTLDSPLAGAAEVLAASWRAGGTRARSRAAFAQALSAMVADFQVTQTAEETEVRLNVPQEDFATAATLLSELLRNPRPLNADVQTVMAGATAPNPSGYEGSLPGAVAVFHAHLYDGHPLGRRPGSEGRVSPARALAFYRDAVTPGSTVLYVGGGVSKDVAEQVLTTAFAEWGAAEATERDPAPPLESDARRDVILHDVEKLQGWVVIGHELPVVPIEDEASLQVMNYILGGGHFDTRLFRATRDRRGLTNDDSGFLNPGVRAPGSYTFQTYGRPDVVPLLIHLTLQEIDRIRDEPVSEEELFVAQGALADGEFTLGFRSAEAAARTFAREWSRYGDHERSATYPERLRAVTVQDVQTAARKYLLPERLDVVVVGPMDEILAAQPIEDEVPVRALGRAAGPGSGM